jgi:1,4-dihydroxy-2-naphthoate octaprenyltransferase
MAGIQPFAGVARAPFLLLPVTLVASGAAASAYSNGFSWLRTGLALVGMLALHIAVNALNEWSDYRTKIDLETARTPFSGGSGTLPSGSLSGRTTLIFALAWAAVGLAIGIWFLEVVGTIILPFVIVGGVCVLFYTDVLARMGLGEMAAGLGLGALPVMGTAVVQDGFLTDAAIAASVPSFFMTFNLLLLNEFPDEEADRRGGRRNLILLFGRRAAALIYVLAALLTPLSIVVAVGWKMLPSPALAAVLPSLLLARPVGWALRSPTEPVPIPALGSNVIWNLVTNTVMAIALAVTAIMM